jgi:hypothetical protein
VQNYQRKKRITNMTPLQIDVLACAARGGIGAKRDILPGTSLLYEQQFGKMRQVKWLLARKLVYVRYGRLLANKTGRRILDYQTSR